jgi:hypothetical protein
MRTAGSFALLLLALAAAGTAQGGVYVGARNLSSSQSVNGSAPRTGPTYDVEGNTNAAQLYVGYTVRGWSLEGGAGALSARSSHNVSTSFDIRQDIETRITYLALRREIAFGPVSLGVLAGMARVTMRNHEYGWNENGPDQDWHNTTAERVPLFGLSAAYGVEHAVMRVELLRVNNIARSPWTRSSDVTAIAVGLHYTF